MYVFTLAVQGQMLIAASFAVCRLSMEEHLPVHTILGSHPENRRADSGYRLPSPNA
jgi:hypothetical protein